ncbi:carboxylate-amine ligase [Tropicibacter sp. R15_0]|uniref:carboxylate-amine ligase n=1 Tax=Tropicibacter sp. R15_0 TaxID=2821101 RepID=UPI001ADC50CD|nr:carboxylate-amine ligase [Tropicibacter sp. R15_0]MBO9464893.1 carboxylate-amine ligase [Tropicibacter sp. R15_0]
MAEPEFTLGIEEEYLLVDPQSGALVEAPEELMTACAEALPDQVSPEFLQCQIEIGTKPCANITQARDELRKLRAGVAEQAAKFGLAPIAASCHPFADWKQQHHTNKDRYNELDRDLGGVVRRMLICGMHVHVGLNSDPLRADLMRQMGYFLPHLLALSTSSPFWNGRDSGLASYRISVFDNLPRTGLPPQFESWDDYQRSVQVLVNLGVIEDTSRIWWDLRPSSRFPTLETRIMDVQPRMQDTLTLAALTQCLMRMLWRLRKQNQRWRIYENFLIGENRWRAQRYGVSEGLIDYGAAEIMPFATIINDLIDLLHQDAEALGCLPELMRLREIVENGNSTERQRATRQRAAQDGHDEAAQMRAVVHHLIEEFSQDL